MSTTTAIVAAIYDVDLSYQAEFPLSQHRPSHLS